jgi:hypothetical protein
MNGSHATIHAIRLGPTLQECFDRRSRVGRNVEDTPDEADPIPVNLVSIRPIFEQELDIVSVRPQRCAGDFQGGFLPSVVRPQGNTLASR